MSKAGFGDSNLVKSYRLQKDACETILIDSNSRIEEKLERIRMIMPVLDTGSDYGASGNGEFVSGLDVADLDSSMLDALTGDGFSSEVYDENGGFSGVIKATPQYNGPSPEELIEEAKMEIDRMKQDAMAEVEAIKQAAYEEGVNQGYQEGKSAAEAEMSRAWVQISNAQTELEESRASMIAELEPQFIEAITAIYEKIFKVNLSKDRELVVNLLRDTMLRVEKSKNYLIHVSPDDKEYVLARKEELIATSSMPEDATLDIIEDFMMKSGDCMIETSNGIYDCGLDTELEALKKKLIMLSFTV